MKECSYCGHQNKDSATVCEECSTAFAVSEPDDSKLTDPAESLVILETFGDVPTASLLKARLEQAGIEACIPEEVDPSPFGNFKPLAHVTVRVAQKDVEAAREILGGEA
jgi:Putative prokaryotic signal transducing protein